MASIIDEGGGGNSITNSKPDQRAKKKKLPGEPDLYHWGGRKVSRRGRFINNNTRRNTKEYINLRKYGSSDTSKRKGMIMYGGTEKNLRGGEGSACHTFAAKNGRGSF